MSRFARREVVMARYRRWRWVAVIVAFTVAVVVLVFGAESWADRGAASCTTAPARHAVRRPAGVKGAADHDSAAWRTGAFQVAGCRAWHRLRKHDLL
jgi:hypothetical protein